MCPNRGAKHAQQIFCNRARIIHQAKVVAGVKAELAQGDVSQLLITSMSAADYPLVKTILREAAKAEGITTYFVPSSSQCRDRQRTVRLVALADYVQFNGEELELLTGSADPVYGVNWLRTQGVRSVIVHTCGERGICAVVEGNWLYQRAFGVPCSRDCGAGDVVAGTLLRWLQEFGTSDLRKGLRLAAAAAARHVAGKRPAGDWQKLRAFADATPTRRFQPLSRPQRQPARRWALPAGTFAAGIALAVALFFLV